jgi:hypothetical protein
VTYKRKNQSPGKRRSNLDMEDSRANRISQIIKNVGTLGKSLRLPGVSEYRNLPEEANAIGVPVQGSGFVRILMYFVAGILLIGIILLVIDQWITPIFQRTPGSSGYIPMPGTDLSQVYWKTPAEVADITIGTPVPVGGQTALSVTVLEAQTSYSLTLDVYILDEYPHPKIPTPAPLKETLRVFFVMANTPTGNGLKVSLDNNMNKVYITCYDSAGHQQSISIDNVPIHTPFRIGLTISPHLMEGYLNGLLVSSKNLTSIPVSPASGHKIFATSNIKTSDSPPIQLSAGIKVLNVRTFGYVVSTAEMKNRMSDLSSETLFNPSA